MLLEIKNIWHSDNLMAEAWDEALEMIQIDKEMFEEACDAFWVEDAEKLRKAIGKRDKVVNSIEREVRRKLLTHLSVQGTTNLAAGLTLSTIIVDIERIGDTAKNMVTLAVYHPKAIKGETFNDELKKIEGHIKEQFVKLYQCIREGDEELGAEIWEFHKEIKNRCEDILARLVREKVEGMTTNTAAALALYARYLKRINAHISNVASSVINPFDRIGYKPKNEN